VGGHADRQRRAEAASFRSGPCAERTWPAPTVTPARIHVSCDGVMYCTNQREPDPRRPGEKRMIWQQMRVGCVYWQDASEKWHKQMICVCSAMDRLGIGAQFPRGCVLSRVGWAGGSAAGRRESRACG